MARRARLRVSELPARRLRDVRRSSDLGITRDGGYAQYMLARHEAVALLPDGRDGAEAGPLMCAGIATFNALRNSGARAGDLVGVLGIGGLGHLGIQYAAKSGYRVVGVGRGPENAALAKKLGAFAYIDSKATKPAEELQKLGGAKVILATAPSAKAIAELVDGLSVGGKLVIVGAPVEPMEISVLQLLLARRAIQGWPSGTAMDSQETLQFSAFAGVRPMIEKSAGEGEGRVRADDERACGVSRRVDDGLRRGSGAQRRAKAKAASSAPHITGGDRPTSGVRPGAGILRYPISATAAEKPLPRKGHESFPSWPSLAISV